MQKPAHAKRVIYLGMVIGTVLFASFGITGYLSYGDTLQASVTLNLCPKNEITAVYVDKDIIINIFFFLQFFPVGKVAICFRYFLYHICFSSMCQWILWNLCYIEDWID